VHVVFIYGPPAAGKLTVATLVAQKTGFALYDNHVSIDRVTQKYPRSTPQAQELIRDLRKRFFRESARKGKSFVFTFCYVHPSDKPFIEECIALVEGFGGRIHFVQMVPTPNELLRRVTAQSRQSYGKIVDQETLVSLLNSYDLYHEIPGAKSLTIRNDALRAEDASNLIIDYYALQRK